MSSQAVGTVRCVVEGAGVGQYGADCRAFDGTAGTVSHPAPVGNPSFASAFASSIR